EGVVCTSSGAEFLKIKGTGSIKLSKKYGDFIPHHVLYVPDICVNLLSVRCLALEGYDVLFEMNSFFIKKNNSTCMNGHYLSKNSSKTGNSIKKILILRSMRSFQTLRRDSLGYCWTNFSCFMQRTLIFFNCGRQLHKILLSHSNQKQKRCWKRTEFINKYIFDYCNKNLIRTRYSDAYSPQQNGLAERFNRTIIESTRAILKDSGLSLHFWNEIIKASTLTLNQIPSHRSKKSPFELFKNRSLPLDYFKPIGLRVAYRNLPDGSNSKLAQVGGLGKVIGYTDELRSYRVLTDDGKIINSKHLKFLDFEASSENIGDLTFDDENDEEIPVMENPQSVEQQLDDDIEVEDESLTLEENNSPEENENEDINSEISDSEEVAAGLVPEG
ncbi:hypothetical protein VP01_5140g1, partial [Puccinia sorghi]